MEAIQIKPRSIARRRKRGPIRSTIFVLGIVWFGIAGAIAGLYVLEAMGKDSGQLLEMLRSVLP